MSAENKVLKRNPNKPTFEIYESQRQWIFEFVLDENGHPIKLGDGTFGIVFKIKSQSTYFAIKLFYDKPGKFHNSTISFDKESISKFAEKFQIRKNSRIYKSLLELNKLSLSIAKFVFELQKLELPLEQLEYLTENAIKSYGNNEVVENRYIFERHASDDIKRKTGGDKFTGVINIEAGINDFKNSKAYKLLKNKLGVGGTDISNYGIVMPLYDFTLKDFLERSTNNYVVTRSTIQKYLPEAEVPNIDIQGITRKVYSKKETLIEKINQISKLSEDDKQELIDHIYELNGYDLLKYMDYPDRLATIMPYLIDICQGLRALHLAGLYHYDLKPANIFVKLEGDRVSSVIGDLGFFMLPEIRRQETVSTGVLEYLPLGTRHYRSPEQKDYFDICDVKITGKGEILIRDPKFKDTIIDVGDEMVLGKDTRRRKYVIKSKEIANGYVKITLEKTSKDLVPDESTQVIFYKNQKIRTDLFGFGALVFDMITGGKSPERFYDKIRLQDDEKTHIRRLLENYEQVSNYQITDPELLHIFSDFKKEDSKDYVPKEVVELILKCMMYKAGGTYHQEFLEDDEQVTPMSRIFNILKKYPRLDIDNPLYKKNYITSDSSIQSFDLKTKISELQETKIKNLNLRLAHGIWYFKQLVELTKQTLKDQKVNKFFCEFLPNNIQVNNKGLDSLLTTYEKEKLYKRDLIEDMVHAKITRDITNPFVPNYLTFFRRKIQLRPVPELKNRFEFAFLESALLGNEMELGDWIIIDKNLCEIVGINGNEVEIKYDDPSNGSEEISLGFNLQNGDNTEEKKSILKASQHIYYKRINPDYYYLQILGMYLYNIFFAGQGSAPIDKPLLITVAQCARYLSNLQEPVKIASLEEVNKSGNSLLEDIYNTLTLMYLKLMFPEHRLSYYSEYKINGKESERILFLLEDVANLQRSIENLMQLAPNKLDDLLSADELKEIPVEDEGIIDFEMLVRKYIEVSIERIPEEEVEDYDEMSNIKSSSGGRWRGRLFPSVNDIRDMMGINHPQPEKFVIPENNSDENLAIADVDDIELKKDKYQSEEIELDENYQEPSGENSKADDLPKGSKIDIDGNRSESD